MSRQFYGRLAANPGWLGANYSYQDDTIASQCEFSYGGEDPDFRTCNALSAGFSQDVKPGLVLALEQGATVAEPRLQIESHLGRHIEIPGVNLKEQNTSLGFAAASEITFGQQTSLFREDAWFTEAGAPGLQQFHAGTPNEIHSASQNAGRLASTHSSLGADTASEGSLRIIPYSPDTVAPKGQKRKRIQDGPLNVTQKMVRLDNTTGRILGEFYTMGSRQKTRTRLGEERRKETAIARRSGTCERCKRLKIRCDRHKATSPYEACNPCKSSNPYRLRMPCFQDKITVASFFRLRPAFKSPLETTIRVQIFELADVSQSLVQQRTLRLTQDLGLEITVQVSKFNPIEGDKTAYEWIDESGVPKKMEMPPYCLTNLDMAMHNMCLYAKKSRDRLLYQMLQNTNDITWDTIRMAMRVVASDKNSIVRLALELWSMSRIIELTWRICGSDTLGLETIHDPTNRWDGIIPVTPIMDTQLDQIVIRGLLVPLSKTLLRLLEYMIHEHNRPDTWFEIYLTCFILMTTAESAAIHGKAFAKRYGLSTRYSSHDQMEELFHGAQIILAYFHYACNGSTPLTVNWTDPKRAKFAKLDAEQVKYMVRTQGRITKKEKEVRSLYLRHKYDTHLYWAHQLWFPNWKGAVVHIENEIP